MHVLPTGTVNFFLVIKEFRKKILIACFVFALYMFNCGGAYRILDNGCKDCTLCTYPHERKNYDAIMGRFPEIVSIMNK